MMQAHVVRVGRGGQSLSVATITTLEEAERLADPWSVLMENALDREPFLTPEWYLAWWRAFGDGEMRLLAVRRGERLVGVAPFRIREERLLGASRKILRMWSNPFSNRVGPVLHREHATVASHAILDALHESAGSWSVARLGPLARDRAGCRALCDALDERGARWGARKRHRSPFVELPDSWKAFEESLSGSYRRSLRRKWRGIREGREVTCRTGGSSPDDADLAFEISRHTWQHEAGTGICSRPAIEAFYRELADVASRRGWLRTAYLFVDGTPAAYEFNLLHRGTLYNLKLGYHQDFADLSPGLVLKQAVLRRAVSEGVEVYDLLGEAEPYKMRWTSRVRPLVEVWIHRSGTIPWLQHQAYFGLRPVVQRHASWVLTLKRRLLDG